MIHDDDDDGALSPALRALLDEGGAGPALPPAVSDRLLGKVMVSVGVTAAAASTSAAASSTTAATTTTATTTAATTTAATTTAATTTAAATLTQALAFKLAVGLVGVASVAGVGLAVRGAAPPSVTPAAPIAAPIVAPIVAPPIAPTTPTAPVVDAGTLVVDTPIDLTETPATAAPKKKAPATPTPTVAPTAAVDEAALLERARSRLAADPEGALVILQQHEDVAKDGALVEEREALRVLALARAGRSAEASAAARAFQQRFPHSLLNDRVARER